MFLIFTLFIITRSEGDVDSLLNEVTSLQSTASELKSVLENEILTHSLFDLRQSLSTLSYELQQLYSPSIPQIQTISRSPLMSSQNWGKSFWTSRPSKQKNDSYTLKYNNEQLNGVGSRKIKAEKNVSITKPVRGARDVPPTIIFSNSGGAENIFQSLPKFGGVALILPKPIQVSSNRSQISFVFNRINGTTSTTFKPYAPNISRKHLPYIFNHQKSRSPLMSFQNRLYGIWIPRPSRYQNFSLNCRGTTPKPCSASSESFIPMPIIYSNSGEAGDIYQPSSHIISSSLQNTYPTNFRFVGKQEHEPVTTTFKPYHFNTSHFPGRFNHQKFRSFNPTTPGPSLNNIPKGTTGITSQPSKTSNTTNPQMTFNSYNSLPNRKWCQLQQLYSLSIPQLQNYQSSLANRLFYMTGPRPTFLKKSIYIPGYYNNDMSLSKSMHRHLFTSYNYSPHDLRYHNEKINGIKQEQHEQDSKQTTIQKPQAPNSSFYSNRHRIQPSIITHHLPSTSNVRFQMKNPTGSVPI